MYPRPFKEMIVMIITEGTTLFKSDACFGRCFNFNVIDSPYPQKQQLWGHNPSGGIGQYWAIKAWVDLCFCIPPSQSVSLGSVPNSGGWMPWLATSADLALWRPTRAGPCCLPYPTRRPSRIIFVFLSPSSPQFSPYILLTASPNYVSKIFKFSFFLSFH